jgi:hypothetical protein
MDRDWSFVGRRSDESLHLPYATFNSVKLAQDRRASARAGPSLKLQWFVPFKANEEIGERHFERLRDANERRKAKILPPGLKVPDERPVHLKVVRKRLLRCKAALNADITYPLPEAAKYWFHASSVKDGLPDGLPLDR